MTSSRDERKKMVAQIMGSLKEYSTEEINDTESAKAEILQLLKTHRAVKLCDREYGISRNLKNNYRLIVKELEDGSNAREYMLNRNKWYCINVCSKILKCKSLNLQIVNGIVFAPLEHRCEARKYSLVMRIQNLLKKGKITEADRLTHRLTHSSPNDDSSKSSSSTSVVNESTFSHADQDDNSIAESLLPENATLSNLTPSSPRHSPFVEDTVTHSAGTSINQHVADDSDDSCSIILVTPAVKRPKLEDEEDDCCILVNETAAKRAKHEESNNDKSFELYRPSSNDLKQICKKLNIDSNNNAYKLWGDIAFQDIPSIANNIQAHSFKSPNFFACLSLLFTGKPNSCFLIQHAINEAFREDPRTLDTISGEEIDQILINNNTVYDEQVEFIASYLSCRIGLYYTGRLKKFGKWENHTDEEDVLTLILSFDAGLFSVVLDLE